MKYDEMTHYNNYVESKSVKDRTKTLMALRPLLFKKHLQLAGTLPDSALQAEISRHAMGAIDTYDPTKGAKLSTHVFNHIAQASRLNYTYQNVVRMSEDKQQGKYKHYKKAIDDLDAELNREPTEQEIATRLGWTIKEVNGMRDSLFADINESKMEVDNEISRYSDDNIKMDYVLSNLNDAEKEFFKDKTSGMSQDELKDKHKLDINKVNYTNRTLTNKVKSLLEKYDGRK